MFLILYDAPYNYYIKDGAIHGLRGLLSVGGLFGCFFYSLGIKFLTRKFWKVYFIVMLLDEIYCFVFEIPFGVMALVSALTIVPMFLILFLYSFKNMTIWEETFTFS